MMKGLLEEIRKVLQLIDMLGELLAGGLPIEIEELFNTVGNGILNVFPDIVDSYQRKELIPYKGEAEYWSVQLERIISAFRGKDMFRLYDVLLCETAKSLKEYEQRAKTIFE